MAVRPIIFSGAMVNALLSGRKTQTRRLATSPLRRCEPRDLLYVRENWQEVAEGCLCITQADYPQCVPAHFENVPPIEEIKWRPSIHMPRRLSRLTLEVTGVRVEPLQAISAADAEAEGVFRHIAPHSIDKVFREERGPIAVRYYRELWESLHGAGSWAACPDVLVLTFKVERGNVDRLPYRFAA